MNTSAAPVVVACPTCGTLIFAAAGPGPACPNCGLPAAGHAGYVVARIEATLVEFQTDRDRLLDSLHELATAGRRAAQPDTAATGAPVSEPDPDLVPGHPRPSTQLAAPVIGWAPESPDPAVVESPPRPARRRLFSGLSPQQLLLGTGAVLLVSAAIAFVAVAWGSLGLFVQATTLVALTGSVCTASVLAARRGLRTTGEALAMAGLALLMVDLVAARTKGVAGLDQLAGRAHVALTLGVVIAVSLGLHRVAQTTLTWPIGALVAAQPLAFLALPEVARVPVPLVATALLVSAFNVTVVRNATARLADTATGFAGLWWAGGTVLGTVSAWSSSYAESALCTLLVAVAAGAGVRAARSARLDRFGQLPAMSDVWAGTVVTIALSGTLQQFGTVGLFLTGVLGLALLTFAVMLRVASAAARERLSIPASVCAVIATGLAVAQLTEGRDWIELAVLAMLAAVCSVGIAVRDRRIRGPVAALAVVLPGVAVLLLVADALTAQQGGWFLAVLGASALALASTRVHQVEERWLAGAATIVGLTAGPLTATTFAWGQLAIQLSVTGAALLAYGRTARNRPATLVGLADLVLAGWIGAAGLSVTTPEVFTLPAAFALLLASGAGLRTAPSWSAWGTPLVVGLIPSTLLVLDQPDALRLVLIALAATACAVGGTITHRQAPFVIGLGVLATLAVSELGPYATLLPRWISLGLAGIVLLAVGATYERRLAQAREAVAWVSGLR